MDAVYWLPITGIVAQAGWFAVKVGGRLALFCIHGVNRVNSHNMSPPRRQPLYSVNTVLAIAPIGADELANESVDLRYRMTLIEIVAHMQRR